MAHPPENQFAAWLGEVHALAQERMHEVYLIADQSGLPRLGEAQTMLQGMALRNILSSAPECEFDGASPLLVQTSGATPLRTARLARWLHVQGRYANCLAVLVSPLDITALHTQLRQRTELMLPGNLRMVLRYFDTRSLPLLPRLLTEPQYAAFTACATEWHYLDRAGEVQRLPAPAQPFAGEFTAPLEMTAAQEQMLIDDGLADSVIDQLLDARTPALMGLTPPQQYARIAPLVTAALHWGLNDTLPTLHFVGVALQEGDDFASKEPWAGQLAAYRSGKLELADALQRSDA